MASLTTCNQRLVAAGVVAPPRMRWSDATVPAGNRHATFVTIPASATYEVKPVHTGISRRPSEGST